MTALMVLALTLGIGGNTAIFSVINGIFLKPLAFPEPDRVFQVLRGFVQGDVPYVSPPKFRYWKEHTESFAAMAGWEGLGTGFNLVAGGKPERIVGSRVTAEFFAVFGVSAVLGRGFRPEDDRLGAPPVVILSHGFWQRRFGADPGIVGRSLILNGESHLVIGVAPAGFRIPETAELWIPACLDPADHTDANTLFVSARLKPGVDPKSARAEVRTIGQQFLATEASSEPDSPEVVTLSSMQEFLYGDLRPALLVILASVGLVLLIACANVANLQLARSMSRRKEIAVRTALGATSGNIFRQLLIEALVLAVIGGGLGLALSAVMIRPLLAASPLDVPRLQEVGIDGQVLLFTLALSLLTGVLFGIVPSRLASRVNFSDTLRSGSQRITGGAKAGRARTALVGSQIALAVVLMIGASLLLRSFFILRSTDPGFEASHLLTLKMSLSEKYFSPEALEGLARRLIPDLIGLPGVDHATLVSSLPFEIGADMSFLIAGRDPSSSSGMGQGRYVAMGGEYFQALEIPLRKGRFLEERDRHGSELVAVINEAAVRLYWPDEEPLGQRIHVGLPHVSHPHGRVAG